MVTVLAFSAAMGWCGTPWPGWVWWLLRKRKPWPPPPPPWDDWLQKVADPGQPVPWHIAIGMLGGIAAGWSMNAAVGAEQWAAVGLAAFAGGRIANEIAALARR